MLLEQISKENMKKYIKKYYNYAKKILDIEKAPKIKFIHDEDNANNFLGKTAFYNPETMSIYLYVTDRHPKDIVRSFAHELIHHYQNLNEKLPAEILHKTIDVDYASKDSQLRDMEREAFEKGNMMFRDWTDSLKVKNNLTENKMKKQKSKVNKETTPPEADINNNGEIEGWEEARSNAIQKSKTKQRKLEEQENIESVDPRFSKMFEQEARVMNDYKTKREEIIYKELMRRFLGK